MQAGIQETALGRAFEAACEAGRLAVVEHFLRHGGDIPLQYLNAGLAGACRSGHGSVVACLLTAGIDFHECYHRALGEAIHEVRADIVHQLVMADATVDWTSDTVKETFEETLVDRYDDDEPDDILKYLMWAGAPMDGIVNWDQYSDDGRLGLVVCARPRSYALLPDDMQPLWIQHRPRLTWRLRRLLQRARDRLDRPPTTLLGTQRPTRDQLIAHLASAGRRFAREYWMEGAAFLLPDVADQLGPVPDEFALLDDGAVPPPDSKRRRETNRH